MLTHICGFGLDASAWPDPNHALLTTEGVESFHHRLPEACPVSSSSADPHQKGTAVMPCSWPAWLLCVDWLGSAPKASRTLTFSSWSSLGLWIPSYSAATWRRVLCSGCGRRKTFGCSQAPSEYTPVNTPEYTQALLILFILNLFLCEINGGRNLRATSSNSLWSLGIFFVFYFLTSVAFQLQMLKFIMANMTDCHG